MRCLISTRVMGVGASRARLAEGVLYDVTEHRLTESAVRQPAEHVQLTGLRNRAACEAAIEAWCSAPDAPSGPLTAMVIDLAGIGQAHIGLSIGGAAYPMHGKTAQDVMRAADEAMYQVKRTGKNSVAMAVPGRE